MALGGRRRTTNEAIAALEEAIAVIRAIWSGQRDLRYDGTHYALWGADGGPMPAHPIGLWVGAVGERMLRLTGRLANGWAAPIVSYLPYERWGWAQDVIDDAARQAERDPADVRRVANLVGSITSHGDAGQPRGSDPIRGTGVYWVQVLSTLVLEMRFDTLIFWPEEPSVDQIERFARDIVPAVRESVKAERTQG